MTWYCLKELCWKPDVCQACETAARDNSHVCETLQWGERQMIFFDFNPEMKDVAQEGHLRLARHRLLKLNRILA